MHVVSSRSYLYRSTSPYLFVLGQRTGATMNRGLVCPEKAQEFDQLHANAPKYGRSNTGAKELAGGYTLGEVCMTFEEWGGARADHSVLSIE